MTTRCLISLLLSLVLHLLRMVWELSVVLRFLGQTVRGRGAGFWLHHGLEVIQRPVFWVAVVFWAGLILLGLDAARKLSGDSKGRSPGVTRAKAELEGDHD